MRLSEAPSFGQPIIVFDPTSRGAIAYRELAKEVSGAPQWAGILAAADQLRVVKKKAVLAASSTVTTNPTPAGAAVYSLTSGMSDVATGAANGSCGSICTAAVGYDAVTGLGSPRTGIDAALANTP